MDPLTLTATAIGLVTKAVDSIQKLNSFHSKWENLPLDLLSLEGQCDAVSFALLQIHDTLCSSPQIVRALTAEQDISAKQFAKVLASCEVRFHILSSKLDDYVSQAYSANAQEIGFRGKTKLIWNDNGIQIASKNLSRIAEGLSLVLHALSLKSSLELQKMLSEKRNSAVLDDVTADAISIASSDQVSILLEPDKSTSSAHASIAEEPTIDLALARLALAEASLTRSGGISCFISHSDADFIARVAAAEEKIKDGSKSSQIRGFTLDLQKSCPNEIPPHWIELVATRLETVSLACNSLQELPAQFSICTKLRDLSLRRNKFSRIPNCIFDLEALKCLDVSQNEIKFIPGIPFTRLRSLQILHLSENPISSLPSEFGYMENLQRIGISGLDLRFPPQILFSVILSEVVGLDSLGQPNEPDRRSPEFCNKVKELLRALGREQARTIYWCLKCGDLSSCRAGRSFRLLNVDPRSISTLGIACSGTTCKRKLQGSGSSCVWFDGEYICCNACFYDVYKYSCSACSHLAPKDAVMLPGEQSMKSGKSIAPDISSTERVEANTKASKPRLNDQPDGFIESSGTLALLDELVTGESLLEIPEKIDHEPRDESLFWIPQATPDGRLFYFNTLTRASTMPLPLEVPSAGHGSEGNHDDDASPPTEEADVDDLDEAAFWIPQVTIDGRLFYFNTGTGVSTMELPLPTER